MKLYVLVDNTLPLGYQGVQAAHIVAEWLIKNPLDALLWNNGTLVVLQTDNVLEELYDCHMNCTRFYEPDVNKVTGFACYCDGKIFKKLKLMGR